MEENKNNRCKWLHLRLTEAEYKRLEKGFTKSTERKLSAYARKVFLAEPVIVGYRNLSLDDAIAQFIILNKTLNGIANNYNQSIHKLHTFDHVPQVSQWLIQNENAPQQLAENIGIIKALIKKILTNGIGN